VVFDIYKTDFMFLLDRNELMSVYLLFTSISNVFGVKGEIDESRYVIHKGSVLLLYVKHLNCHFRTDI